MRGNPDFDSFSARLKQFIRASACSQPASDAQFNDFAVELFALQFENNEVYRNYCQQQGVSPRTIRTWTQIPAVPTTAFKEYEVSCLRPEERSAVFYSSGTTEHRPSRHFHNRASLDLYETSLLEWFFAAVRGAPSRPHAPLEAVDLIVLTPPPQQAEHSSLVHMFEMIRRAMHQPVDVFFATVRPDRSWVSNLEMVAKRLRNLENPCFVLGTAFSFVHLIDSLQQENTQFKLPPGSRALETGGYKGRSRSLEKKDLHLEIEKVLGINPQNIIGEYGMSELSSQAYDLSRNIRLDPGAFPSRPFYFPPWAKLQIVSPETGHQAAEGESGLVRVFDLANTYSAMAIQTEDVAIRRGDGFELIGRAALAEPRGCSLLSV